jgi:hypothetical protein
VFLGRVDHRIRLGERHPDDAGDSGVHLFGHPRPRGRLRDPDGAIGREADDEIRVRVRRGDQDSLQDVDHVGRLEDVDDSDDALDPWRLPLAGRRSVAQLLGHLQNTVAGVLGDVTATVESLGDRSLGDAGQPRDILDRDSLR